MLKAGFKAEVYNYVFWIMERSWKVLVENSKNMEFVPRVVVIHDWNGVSWSQFNSAEGSIFYLLY
jgi:hypothetical protein